MSKITGIIQACKNKISQKSKYNIKNTKMEKIKEYIYHWEISKILFVLLIGVILLLLVSPKRMTNKDPDLSMRLKVDTQALDR